jgi:hypothetical protein
VAVHYKYRRSGEAGCLPFRIGKCGLFCIKDFSHRGSRLSREERRHGLLRWPRPSLLFLIRSPARWLQNSNKKCSAYPAYEQRFKEWQASELWKVRTCGSWLYITPRPRMSVSQVKAVWKVNVCLNYVGLYMHRQVFVRVRTVRDEKCSWFTTSVRILTL